MVSTNGTGLEEPVRAESVREQRYRQRRQAKLDAHEARQNYDRILNEFQPDAVEIERQPVPGGVRWTLYAVIALLIAAVTWSCWAEVDQIVVAQGKLVTTVPPILIDTKLASPIRSVDVQFGDRVVAGQQLATLDPTVSQSDVDRLEAKQKLLLAQKARLMAEQSGQEFSLAGYENDRDWLMQFKAFEERRNEFRAKIREFDAEQSKLEVQQANNLNEIEHHKENFVDYRKYEEDIRRLAERKHKSETDVLSRKLQSNDALMKVRQAESRRLELEKEVESLLTRRQAYLASWRSEIVMKLVETHEKIVEIEQDLTKAYQAQEYVSVTVPDSLSYKEFVVFEVSENSVGSVMEPGEPLFRLIPLGVPVEAEVEIAGKDIARISEATPEQIESGEIPPGSDVRVKLASFPFQKHGTLNGVVRTISEDSFEKELPNGSAATMYKARVRLLEPIQLENVPESFRLMPGMNSTAEIRVGKRRVIEYFLYPLIRYMDTSIREP
jgi:hemolysin D